MRKAVFGILALFCVQPAHAGSFYLQEQSAAAMGTAYAGAGALPRDSSILYYNPAGMTGLKAPQVSLGASMLAAQADNHNSGSTFVGVPVGDSDSDDPLPFSVLPHGYAAAPVTDRLWLGIGVSAPFGLATKYNGDWYGRFDSVKSVLKVVDIQPTVAYKATDWLSVGAGINIQYADATLTNVVSNGVSAGPAGIEGSDWSAGYNLGVMAEPVEGTHIGVNYRSPVTHELDGTVTVAGVPGFNENSGGSADLDLPDIIGLSVAQEMMPDWTIMAQVNYFGWDRFSDITVIRDNGTTAKSITENYKSTLSFALGAEYMWNDKTTLRFGYQYDQTPTRDEFRDTRVPDGNRNNIAAGVGYALCPSLTLNAAAMLTFISDKDINVRRNANLAAIRSERDDTSILLGSLGVSYRF